MAPDPSRFEVLAPVGDMDMCRAAVHNGADAIYVGFPGFNARGRTVDHGWDALEEMAAFCHFHGVKIFLALNVLIFENELRVLLESLPRALAMGVDAFIVQDLGLARLVRFLSPTQILHASTQMTVTSHDAIDLTEDLSLARYVLGREVSLKEMEIIRGRTRKELEVFVHGALCVSYSGQCLTSEGFGGRSANRGQCAQSCRMEYDLMVDGERKELGDRAYLVSPKDLCGLEDVPRLMELGIDSFKIEGRLKTPQYVASTVSAYKGAIAGKPADEDTLRNLQVTYSRGFFNGWMGGVDHQRLVDGRYGAHRGLEIGKVTGRRGPALLVASNHAVKAGDGLLFADYATGKTWGGRVFSASAAGARGGEDVLEIAFGNDFPAGEITPGASAYLNDDPALEKEIRRSWADKSLWKTLPASIRMEGAEGGPLRVTVAQGAHAGAAASEALLQKARNPATALTRERGEAEAAALSGSGLHLAGFDFAVAPGLFLPDKELRKARQAAVAALQAKRASRPEIILRSAEEAAAFIESEAGRCAAKMATAGTQAAAVSGAAGADAAGAGTGAGARAQAQGKARLNLLIRERSSIDALTGLPLDTVYLDFEHGKDYKPAVEAVRALGFKAGVATTRILKPDEYHNLKVIEALRPDAVLVRNLGALHYLAGKGLRLAGDFSLNASNSLAAGYLLEKGLSSLCPSYDLNQWQLFDLLDAVGGGPFEVTVHQYLPSFHMEHCVFAAFLSKGSSFRDCGKPCETHRIELRDHTGASHPVKADQECRNTMFNGKPQSAARLVPELLSRGVGRFRVEALYEDAETLRAKVTEYARLVSGAAAAEDVLARMGVVEKYGVMEGQLRNAAVHRDRKKG
jgi:putative protease